MTPAPDADRGAARRTRTLLWGIVAVAALLRLLYIGAQSLWIDEYLTLEVATPKPGFPLWQLLRHNVHGPLHTFVVFLFRSISENDGWLRVPSALAGTATVPLLFAWMRPRWGERAALAGALLLAINPLHVHYSQELRNYAFAVLFVMAAAVCVDLLVARASPARLLGLAACIAASVLSNFSATFSLLGHAVSYFRRAGVSRVHLLRFATVLAFVAAFTSPWIYRLTTYVDFEELATPVLPGQLPEAERLRGDTTFRVEAIPYAAFVYSVGFSLGPSLRELHDESTLASVVARHGAVVAWVALCFGVLLVLGVVRSARASRAVTTEALLYIIVPLVVTLALNWQNAKAFNVRYVLVGLPMYLALIAVGMVSLRRWASWLSGGVVVATCVASLWNYYFDPRYRKEDVRGALRAVEARLQPGECLFAPTVWQIVQHYSRTDAAIHYVYRHPPDDAVMQDQLARLVMQCESLWYFRARPWVDDSDGRILSTIDARYARQETLEFPGVSAIHFVHKP
jgi:uncharacterized membrane protein